MCIAQFCLKFASKEWVDGGSAGGLLLLWILPSSSDSCTAHPHKPPQPPQIPYKPSPKPPGIPVSRDSREYKPQISLPFPYRGIL